jgi:hypothetical protein
MDYLISNKVVAIAQLMVRLYPAEEQLGRG